MCDSLNWAGCVPTFARENKRGPFVGEVEKCNEKRLGDKIYGSSFARFFSSAGVEGSQRTGKCMYIKARWNQGLQMRRSEQFCWQRKATLCPQTGRPLFRRASRCVRSFSERRVCTHFACESKRGPFVREVEKRFELEVVTVTFWRYSWK